MHIINIFVEVKISTVIQYPGLELGACNLGQKVIHTADSHLELEKSHDAQGM